MTTRLQRKGLEEVQSMRHGPWVNYNTINPPVSFLPAAALHEDEHEMEG
jgi:hypothetical protein